MSRPWMPFYVGDYLRNTGHLTTEQHGAYLLLIMHCWEHERLPEMEANRAAIARVSLKAWKSMRPVVEAFFQPDGSHKRVTEEIEKSEKKWMQRTLAGRAGGIKSGISRSIKQANSQANMKRERSERLSETPSESEAKTNLPRTNHISKNITSTFSASAREESSESSNTATSLATALPTGALARSPLTESGAKRPHELSRAEIDAAIAGRQGRKEAH
jgi:uncharacterized protein YdaU (DUF1376 family)